MTSAWLLIWKLMYIADSLRCPKNYSAVSSGVVNFPENLIFPEISGNISRSLQGRQRQRGRRRGIDGNVWSAGDGIFYIPPKFVIVVFIIVNRVLTVHIIWRNGWRKMHKNAQIFVLKFKHFPGTIPDPMLGRCPYSKPFLLGTPAQCIF